MIAMKGANRSPITPIKGSSMIAASHIVPKKKTNKTALIFLSPTRLTTSGDPTFKSPVKASFEPR
ncbi:hypothetical protein GCM10007094_43320 [Pseudovibrio japonicus]|uniref:Uncharacterized protein n=1 Tax=Pseudovibrio japonicus TaxID=366534 RepID=A0ABQ3EPN6_9HYPH|nr:hypothetical protein GCM10007094_43320 [Pseudovibrio japonicus]